MMAEMARSPRIVRGAGYVRPSPRVGGSPSTLDSRPPNIGLGKSTAESAFGAFTWCSATQSRRLHRKGLVKFASTLGPAYQVRILTDYTPRQRERRALAPLQSRRRF